VKSAVFPPPDGPTIPTSSATSRRGYATAPKPTRLSRAKRLTYTTRASDTV
jgi:hypothetical protein